MRLGVRGLAPHVLRHPGDAVVLARAGWRLRRRRWWRQRPFLPVPDPRYWEFRLATSLGDPSGSLSAHEAVGAAKWALAQRRGK
jgi:hypothetical protein